jgi:GT2 family glycosyltransferase
MDLSVVLVSYNTRDLLEQALRTALEAAEGLQVEFFVVDNASRDHSAEMVAEKFPQVKLIRSPRNLGFAGGNNLALRQVQGRHVLLLNTDTVVRRDTLRCLVEFLDAHPEAGAAGCKILNPDGSLQLACRRGFPTPMAAFCKVSGLSRLFPRSRRLARYNLTYLDPEQTSEVDALSGSCMMVRKAAMDQVGLLDEDYFMYGEDLDWCYRLRQAGWRIYYVPHTAIVHFKGESGRAEQMRVRYRFYEAMSIFARKHMQQRYRFFPLWLLHVGIALYGLGSLGVRVGRRLALPALDGLLVLAGLKLGIALRYHSSLTPLIRSIERLGNQLGVEVHPTRWLTPPPYTDLQWFVVYAGSTATWLLAFYLLGLYDRHRLSPARAAWAVTAGFAGVVTVVFFFKAYNFSRLAAGAAWFFNVGLVAGWRLAAGHLVQVRRLGRRRLLVVGTEPVVARFLEHLGAHPQWEVVGLVGSSPEWRGQRLAGKQVLGLVEELPQLLRDYEVSEIVFTESTLAHALPQARQGWRRRRLRLHVLPGSFAELVAGQAPGSPLPLVEISTRR